MQDHTPAIQIQLLNVNTAARRNARMIPDASIADFAIFGWTEPLSRSPLGVSVMSTQDGRVTPWWTMFCCDDPSRASWLPDGSLLVAVWDTPQTVSLYRLHGPNAIERLGTVPRALNEITVSNDLKRAALVTTDVRTQLTIRSVLRP